MTDSSGDSQQVEFIVKGGTSLSRAYGLIERFSEDVDLLVAFPAAESTGQRDKFLREVCAGVAEHVGVPIDRCEAITSTKGVKRNVRYPYPPAWNSPDVAEGVLLEMGSLGGTYPIATCEIRSLAATYAIDEAHDDPSTWAEFAPVSVAVLAPERTLLEKLALLHHAASRFPAEVGTRTLRRAGRHLYDVHALLAAESVRQALVALGQGGVEDLAADIDEHSRAAKFDFTPRPASGYGDSPLFRADAACAAVAASRYASALRLVHGQAPTFDDCLDACRRACDLELTEPGGPWRTIGIDPMQFMHHYDGMKKQDVRKTTPFTADEDEQLQAFSQPETWERQSLERLSPIQLREGSEGAVVRALALLGMTYVREHAALSENLAAGYSELASERARQNAQVSEAARTSGMRSNMARRARPGSATRAG